MDNKFENKSATYVYRALCPNCEIRRVEDKKTVWTDKKTGKEIERHCIRLTCLQECNGEETMIYMEDKDTSRMSCYKRGMIGTFELRVDVQEGFKGHTKVTVVGFEEDK